MEQLHLAFRKMQDALYKHLNKNNVNKIPILIAINLLIRLQAGLLSKGRN
jgi:hypothetical protein